MNSKMNLISFSRTFNFHVVLMHKQKSFECQDQIFLSFQLETGLLLEVEPIEISKHRVGGPHTKNWS